MQKSTGGYRGIHNLPTLGLQVPIYTTIGLYNWVELLLRFQQIGGGGKRGVLM